MKKPILALFGERMRYEELKQKVQTDDQVLYDVLMIIANSPIQDDFYKMLAWHFPCKKQERKREGVVIDADCALCTLYLMW